MKKTVFAAIIIATASLSAMADSVTNIGIVKGKVIGNAVEVSPVVFGILTKAELEKLKPVDLTLRVVNPQPGEKYEICPVFDSKNRHGNDSVDIAVHSHQKGGLIATFYRDDGKTLLTPEKCWAVEDAQKRIAATMVIKPIGSYFGDLSMDRVEFVAKPLTAR